MEVRKGILEDFIGSEKTGMAVLVVKDSDGISERVMCDYDSTSKKLESLFGDEYKDKEISWSMDEFDLFLDDFTKA